MLFRWVLNGFKKIVIVERIGGVSASGAGGLSGFMIKLITGLLDLKLHSIEGNCEVEFMVLGLECLIPNIPLLLFQAVRSC
jgi:hypothetical protein